MSQKRQKDYPCLKCDEHCKKGAAAIQCNLCDQWAHPACANISDTLFKELVHQYDNNGGTTWSCKSCRAAAEKLNKKINEIYKKVHHLEERTTANEDDISVLKSGISNLEKKIQDNKVERKTTMGEAQGAVFGELRDREERKGNLVIHNIPEHKKDSTAKERKEADSLYIKNLLKKMKVDQQVQQDIKFMRRLGEYSEKPRPLLIGLHKEQSKKEILQKARNLNKADRISIVPDLTARQRKEDEELRKEVERRNNEMSASESLNYHWRLVGIKGERRIAKLPKPPENPNLEPLGARRRQVRPRSEGSSEEESLNPAKKH
jgi:hypothetical protein